VGRSRRPRRSPAAKLNAKLEGLILDLRERRRLGPKLIQAELLRLHECRLSTATIWKALHRAGAPTLRPRRRHPAPKRYSRPIPGERIQMDTFKVSAGLYQYTAVDDCSRVRVLGLYPRRAAKYSIDFLVNRVLEEMPFPIQRLQTDRGGEFFALSFQATLREYAIKFRPIPPRSPHLNGKVERSQQTDWVEFYATADLADPDLPLRLEEWQFFYNWRRPHWRSSRSTVGIDLR
jgi:transposase InsO family protein